MQEAMLVNTKCTCDGTCLNVRSDAGDTIGSWGIKYHVFTYYETIHVTVPFWAVVQQHSILHVYISHGTKFNAWSDAGGCMSSAQVNANIFDKMHTILL